MARNYDSLIAKCDEVCKLIWSPVRSNFLIRKVLKFFFFICLRIIEVTVRSELMEQLPHVAMYCHENSHLFDNPIPHYIVPTVVSYLTAANNQVHYSCLNICASRFVLLTHLVEI